MTDFSWYGVRCIFRHLSLGVYEERVTLWTARSLDEAIGRAETEAREYCEVLEEYVQRFFATGDERTG